MAKLVLPNRENLVTSMRDPFEWVLEVGVREEAGKYIFVCFAIFGLSVYLVGYYPGALPRGSSYILAVILALSLNLGFMFAIAAGVGFLIPEVEQ